MLTSGDLTITAGSITSSGHWQGKRVLITADSLANSGAIQAADSLTARLTGELVSTAGSKVTSNGEMALSALNLSNSGQWIAKNLTLKANSLTSAGDITGVDTLTLTVNQTLNNQASVPLLVTLFWRIVTWLPWTVPRLSSEFPSRESVPAESRLPRLSVVAAFSVVSPWLMISPVLVN